MRQGSIVVLPIPFTDLTSAKQRPCLVISSNKLNKHSDDLIVIAITSNDKFSKNLLSIPLQQSDMQNGTLPIKSYIKLQKVFSIHKTLVRKEVCKIKPEVMNLVLAKFVELIKII